MANSTYGGIIPRPASLAGRTALTLLAVLMVIQTLGLFIHALDRMELQRLAQARNIGVSIASLYRSVQAAPPPERQALLAEVRPEFHIDAKLGDSPTIGDPIPVLPMRYEHEILENMRLVPMPWQTRPQEILMRGDPRHNKLLVAMQLHTGEWLNLRIGMSPPRPWHSPTFLVAFLVMTLTACVAILWAVRRLTAPVQTLATAAEALGRDMNAPPLPEDGPTEVATAAAAFNRMAERIRRFVQDRTMLLAAISHDLRTPITRLKLRAEFIEDDDQRNKFLSDLNELETMVSAALAFGRDAASGEPVTPLDLPSLLRTILDETADAWPDQAELLAYTGPDQLTFRARPVALKRALSNVITNAVKYGGDARVTLRSSSDQSPEQINLTILVEDSGPGIPPDQLNRVFEPFHRVEVSRNRETGGTGLGLPIARNIIRGHNGDIRLANRAEGGVRAIIIFAS